MTELIEYFQPLFAALKTQRAQMQLGVIAVCMAIAWLLAKLVKPRLSSPAPSWKFGAGSAARLLFPLLALSFVWLAKNLMAKSGSLEVMKIAVALLLSFALIRFAIYVLRHVFPPSALLKSWERVIAYTVWAGVALYITGLSEPLLEFLGELSFKVGKKEVSVWQVLLGLISTIATLLIALWLARLAENRLMQARHMDLNLRVVLGKFARAILLVLAILIVLPLVGIDVTLLSVFSGALGVGLGIGLQKIASNYISGFIILLERSIRIGDLITIDNRTGTVSQMRVRYTVVNNADGTEALIPNESFITGTVINHSFSSPKVLVRMPISIAYADKLEQAMQVAADCAKKHTRVLPEPKPETFIKQFTKEGIELELTFWVADPQSGLQSLRSAIYQSVWDAFRGQGIEIYHDKK
ncbi:MAG: mechanosensitive ion channel domain-containing protein [Burkholderiales bacterium]